MKTVGMILFLSSFPLLAGLTGCAGDRYNQSSGQRVDDNRTAKRVREALSADKEFKYGGVKVVAFNGDVQLSGFVNSKAQKNSAGEVATRIVGVKNVDNDITVKD
jgi:osmotically-inducible protein OsmY